MASSQEKPRVQRATPSLDPRVPTLVQPWKRMVEDGLIKELSVSFTPTGVTCQGKAGPELCEVEKSGLNGTDFFPLGKLLSVAELGKLISKPGDKKKNGAAIAPPKPAKSLCKEDLAASFTGLQARINEIAKNCGGGPLVGRVRSAGKFSGTQTTTYQDWWVAAGADHRALSLSVGKNYSSFTDEEKSRLLGLQCPFRGTLEFKVADVEEEEAEQEGPAPASTSPVASATGAGAPAPAAAT